MNSPARSSSFLREAAFGFVVSVVAATLATALGLVLPPSLLARGLVAAIGLTLVLRAIARSREKTGRVVTLAVWIAVAAAAWLSGAGLAAYVAIHLLLVWLVRSLFACSRPIEAGFELALLLLAASAATLAALRTGSVFLACWSFLLVAALGVAIPFLAKRLLQPAAPCLPDSDPNRAFALASRAADEALQRIAARRGGLNESLKEY